MRIELSSRVRRLPGEVISTLIIWMEIASPDFVGISMTFIQIISTNKNWEEQ